MNEINFHKDSLYNNFFKDKGFSMEISPTSGLHFKLTGDTKHWHITIPYKSTHKSFQVGTPITSIGFLHLENLYIDLCYEGITRKKDFHITPKWKIDSISNSTTVLYIQSETPNGVIKSKFENLTVSDFFKLPKEEFTDVTDNYVEYLKTYFAKSATPFFNNVKDIHSLDNLTNELDIYQLSLYLTGIPSLKKILLMHLTDNPKRDKYLESYESRLKPHQTTPNVAALLSSLEKINDYFKST